MENEEFDVNEIRVILEALEYAKHNIRNADYGAHDADMTSLRNETLLSVSAWK